MNSCVIWKGSTNGAGYGSVFFGKRFVGKRQKSRSYLVHRLAYEYWKGPIPKDKVVHHVCNNRRCFNPYHLELMGRSAHGKLHRSQQLNVSRVPPKGFGAS